MKYWMRVGRVGVDSTDGRHISECKLPTPKRGRDQRVESRVRLFHKPAGHDTPYLAGWVTVRIADDGWIEALVPDVYEAEGSAALEETGVSCSIDDVLYLTGTLGSVVVGPGQRHAWADDET